MINEQWVWLGVVVNLLCGLWYARITLLAHTQPNAVSWAIWSLTGWIAVGGQLSEGVGLEVLLTVTVAAIPTAIAAASVIARLGRSQRSAQQVTALDVTCAAASLVTLGVWWLTSSGLVAIALSIAVDAIPAVPVLLQALRSPDSDHPSIWVGGAISATVTLLSLRELTFVSAAFAIYFLTLCSAMTFLLIVLPRLRRTHRPADEPVGTQDRAADHVEAASFAAAFSSEHLRGDTVAHSAAVSPDCAPDLIIVGSTRPDPLDLDVVCVKLRVRCNPASPAPHIPITSSSRSHQPHWQHLLVRVARSDDGQLAIAPAAP